MHVRRSAIALVAASLLITFTVAGCGSDDDKADTTTTTKAASGSTTLPDAATIPSTPDTEPTTTMSPEAFTTAIAAFQTQLDAAGNDFCKIAEAANTLEIGNPGSPEQAESAYKAYASVLTRIADALPADSGVNGAKLKEAAQRILSDAAAAGYDPAALSKGAPESLNEPGTADAMAGVSKLITEQCAPA